MWVWVRARVRVRVRARVRMWVWVRARVRMWVWVRARVRARVEGYRPGLSFEDCVVVVMVVVVGLSAGGPWDAPRMGR